MNNLLDNYIKKELDKIKWGTIRLNIKDFYKKTFIGNNEGLNSNIFIKDLSVIKDFMLR